MSPATAPEALYFGLRLSELITLVGIIIGPISAVLITIAAEARRRRRDQRMQVLRGLIAALKAPGDAIWTVAINSVLLEFHDHKDVMHARREYLKLANDRAIPGQEQSYGDRMLVKQIALVYTIAKTLGFRISEGDLRTEVYLSEGLAKRDELLLDSWRAMRDTATAVARSADAGEKLLHAAVSQKQSD